MKSLIGFLGIGLLALFASAGCGKREEQQFVVVGGENPPPATKPQDKIDAKEPKTDPADKVVPPARSAGPVEPTQVGAFVLPRNLDSVTFAPDGSVLVAISSYGTETTIKLWDTGTGKEKAFKGAKDFRGRIAFMPDGKMLTTAPGKAEDSLIQLWDLGANKVERTIKLAHSFIPCLAVSPDGKVLAVATGDKVVRLIDWKSGKPRPPLEGHSDFISTLAFSADGAVLASGGADKKIKLWDVAAGKEKATLTGHTDGINDLRFIDQDHTLVSASNDKTVRLWDVAAAKEKTAIKQPDNVFALAVTSDGATLVTANFHKGVHFWDLATGKPKGKLRPIDDAASRLALTRDGKTLALGHFNGFVRTFDLTKPLKVLAERATLTQPSEVKWLQLTPDGKKLAVKSGFYNLTVWQVPEGKKLLERPNLFCDGVSPDMKTGAIAQSEKPPSLWDLEANKEVRPFKGGPEFLYQAIFTPDGKIVAGRIGDKGVRLWDVDSGVERATIKDHGSSLDFLAMSADGKLLAGGDKKVTKVWDLANGNKVKHSIDGRITCAAFSADGKLMALGGDNGEADLYDMSKDKIILTVGGHAAANRAVALSPDGKLLATAARYTSRYDDKFKPLPRDDTEAVLRLWHVATGKPAAILHGHTHDVTSVAFAPDGKTLYSGSIDHTVKLWDLTELQEK